MCLWDFHIGGPEKVQLKGFWATMVGLVRCSPQQQELSKDILFFFANASTVFTNNSLKSFTARVLCLCGPDMLRKNS